MTRGGLAWCAMVILFLGMTRDGLKKLGAMRDRYQPPLTFATLREMVGLVAQHHIPVDKQRMKWFGM